MRLAFFIVASKREKLTAYLKQMQSYLMALEYEFTAIGVSDTWLHESICDLYNLSRYNFIKFPQYSSSVSYYQHCSVSLENGLLWSRSLQWCSSVGCKNQRFANGISVWGNFN